jgi:hypothetical protein
MDGHAFRLFAAGCTEELSVPDCAGGAPGALAGVKHLRRVGVSKLWSSTEASFTTDVFSLSRFSSHPARYLHFSLPQWRSPV